MIPVIMCQVSAGDLSFVSLSGHVSAEKHDQHDGTRNNLLPTYCASHRTYYLSVLQLPVGEGGGREQVRAGPARPKNVGLAGSKGWRGGAAEMKPNCASPSSCYRSSAAESFC